MNARQRKKWSGAPCAHQKSYSCGEGYCEYYCKMNGKECMFEDCKHFTVPRYVMRSQNSCKKFEGKLNIDDLRFFELL